MKVFRGILLRPSSGYVLGRPVRLMQQVSPDRLYEGTNVPVVMLTATMMLIKITLLCF
jgi:hypothetical protein